MSHLNYLKSLHYIYQIIAGFLLLIILTFGYLGLTYAKTVDAVHSTQETINQITEDGYNLSTEDFFVWERYEAKSKNFSIFKPQENREIIKALSDLEAKINSDYDKQLEISYQELKYKNSELKSILQKNEGIPIQNTDIYTKYYTEVDGFLENKSLDLTSSKNLILEADKKTSSLIKEIDSSQKEMLLGNLVEMNKQADELLNFFNGYYVFAEQKKSLEQYKSLTNNFSETKIYKERSFVEVKDYLEKEVYPLVQEVQKFRENLDTTKADQKQKWMEAEIANRAAWGMGEAPKAPLARDKLIFVNTREQKMFVYDQGDLVASGWVTTGKKDYETIKGEFKIYHKSRNSKLISPFAEVDYELHVDYWMPFYEGYGIHDTCNSIDCWRTRYGGADYIYAGSHGCVNTPYNLVKFIYEWAPVGTTVYVI